MTITSGGDHWMYLSSTGCLTAGRKKAEYSLFPYVTDDLLHRNKSFTGPVTVIRVQRNNDTILWHPFSNQISSFDIEQNIYKNNLGNTIKFEEINHSLDLIFVYEWQSSDEYGFIKKSKLINKSKKDYDIELIDGLRNIMPANIGLRTQQEMSNLANAYKVSEYLPDANCALFYLNALLMDRPEPGESLYTNIIWSLYNGEKQILVCDVDDFTILQSFDMEGDFDGSQSFNEATINPSPFVLVPSAYEVLDYSYSFPSNSRVIIRVFDISGRFITTLVDKYYESSGTVTRQESSSAWDGTNQMGQVQPPGTYLMHMEASNFQTGKTFIDIAPVVIGVKK